MQDDDDVVKATQTARLIGVTIHIRGTDDRPIVELKDKWDRKVVGGIELKQRLQGIKNWGFPLPF